MDILSHFSINLNSQQESVISKIENFMEGSDRVFLLKGFAGTGKTTLVKGIIKALENDKRKFVVCAPTGRASKILRDKTGYGKTIHSTIYDFNNLLTINSEEKDIAEHSFQYQFPVVKLEENTVVIVDEASMISSRKSQHELFRFGTDVLLDDLMTYAQLQIKSNRNKLILIGDPAQLSPIGDNKSWALEKSFYEKKEISVLEVFLTEVMRQEKNQILENATRIRKCIENQRNRVLEFEFDEESCFNFNEGNIVEKYCELFPVPEFNEGVIINFSNAQNLLYNKEIRKIYFPGKEHICTGDMVQIINNNYHTYGREIFNGDFAKVVSVFETEKISAPVYVDENGKKIKKIFTFSFRKVCLLLPDNPEPFDAYINETLLESTERDLSVDEMKALYINTIMRFQKDFPNSNIKSEQFKSYLKADPFFNALRVKYGYSITGHKSQGGEWKSVIVDYYGQVSLSIMPLRWCYTVTTRASEKLYAVNFPNFGKFYKLNFSSIMPLTKIPADSFDFSKVMVSPFHKTTDHKCKSFLYWNILEKCEGTLLSIDEVRSFLHLEKYSFLLDGIRVNAEAFHNDAGYFRDFKFTSGTEEQHESVRKVLSKPNKVVFPPSYIPTEDCLQDLYKIVQGASNDVGTRITNVVERKKDYFVNYFFETNAECSQIQFYFNGNNEITKALVKSTDLERDFMLRELITKISEYASIPSN